MRVSTQKNPILRLAILLLFSLLIGCNQPNEYVAPPPPTVTVAQPLQQTVIDYLEFTGTTESVASVDVRARVKGFLESMHFTPGTEVKEGDLLFVIDPKPFQARLDAAKAELASAQAQLMKAESDYTRAAAAGKKGAVTERDVVAAQAGRDAAKAAIEAAQAAVTEAELNLSYTQVTAPISGRIGRNRVDVGNLVGDSDATLLTTITQYAPIYAYFNLNERDLLRAMEMYRERIEKKGVDPETESHAAAEIPLYLGLANDEDYPHEGVFDFAEPGVDPGTGTIQLRGIFPNPGDEPVLLPGLFARIRMPLTKRDNALLVSERAIGADQGGQYLLVTNSKNVVEKRSIRTGQLINGMLVIEEGIQAEDWVVVNGIQRARPGAEVNSERTEMASLTVSAMGAEPATAETASPEQEPAPAESSNTAASPELSKEDTLATTESSEDKTPAPTE